MDLTWRDPENGRPFKQGISPYVHYWLEANEDEPPDEPITARELGIVEVAQKVNDDLLADDEIDEPIAGRKTRIDKLVDHVLKEMTAEQIPPAFPDGFGELPGIDALDTVSDLKGDDRNYDPGPEAAEDTAFLTGEAISDDPRKTVLIAIIDDALPFAHQRLTIGGRDARVAAVWMQDAPFPDDPAGIGNDLPFGRELRGGQISAALKRIADGTLAGEESFYREVGAVDFRRASTQSGAFFGNHGAAVADIAAGRAPDDPAARNFPVIAVSLPPEITRDTLGTFSPYYIALAILYVLHRARRLCLWLRAKHGLGEDFRLPVVFNLSYGVTAGSKDGSGYVESFQNQISAIEAHPELGPIHFVLPMGNHRQSRIHARVPHDGSTTLAWTLRPDDATPSFLEFWGPTFTRGDAPATPMQVTLRPPGTAEPITTELQGYGTYQQLLTEDGREVARAYLQRREVGDMVREAVTVVVPPTVPRRAGGRYVVPGVWKISAQSTRKGELEAFVQRDDSLDRLSSGGRQSRFVDPAYSEEFPNGRPREFDVVPPQSPIRRAGTVNAYACADRQIRVGGCYGPEDGKPCDTETTVGYSGLDRANAGRPQEGDVIAPADRSPIRLGIVTMGSLSGSRQAVSGTSMAAPQFTRTLAEAMSNGQFRTVPRDLVAFRKDLAALLEPRTAGPQQAGPTKEF